MVASRDQLLWFAGFYEGEGSVSNDKSNNNRLRLSISQNDPLPLNLAKQLWGGQVYKRVRKSPASDKVCTGYEWRIGHNGATAFIEDIQPFMIIPTKIEQIETVMKRCQQGSNTTYACRFCSKVYSAPSGRRRHEKKEHVQKGQTFECICGNSYKSRDSVRRHQKVCQKYADASGAM